MNEAKAKGGHARAAAMTPEARSAQASEAARARWAKPRRPAAPNNPTAELSALRGQLLALAQNVLEKLGELNERIFKLESAGATRTPRPELSPARDLGRLIEAAAPLARFAAHLREQGRPVSPALSELESAWLEISENWQHDMEKEQDNGIRELGV